MPYARPEPLGRIHQVFRLSISLEDDGENADTTVANAASVAAAAEVKRGGQVYDDANTPALYGSEHILSHMPRGGAQALLALLEAVPRLDELSSGQERKARDLGTWRR